jgi:hypothetical protein
MPMTSSKPVERLQQTTFKFQLKIVMTMHLPFLMWMTSSLFISIITIHFITTTLFKDSIHSFMMSQGYRKWIKEKKSIITIINFLNSGSTEEVSVYQICVTLWKQRKKNHQARVSTKKARKTKMKRWTPVKKSKTWWMQMIPNSPKTKMKIQLMDS